MFKKVLSLVLASAMSISLFACGGGGKEIEYTGSEAANMLKCEYDGFDVVQTNDKFSFFKDGKSTPVNRAGLILKWKISLKDEYKSEYKLKKILTSDVGTKKYSKEIKDISVDREKMYILTTVKTDNFELIEKPGNILWKGCFGEETFNHIPSIDELKKPVSDAEKKVKSYAKDEVQPFIDIRDIRISLVK